MNARRLLVAFSAAMLTIGLPSPAHAQGKAAPARKAQVAQSQPKQPKKVGAKAPAQPEPRQAGGKKPAPRKVVRLEEMRVEGRVQKPQAMFLMPRANVNPGAEPDRSESFLPKAMEAVEKDPF